MTERKPRRLAEPKEGLPPAPARTYDMKRWWNWNLALEHPLTDAQFIEAAMNFLMVHSEDIDIRIVRRRIYNLLQHLSLAEIMRDLAEYRKEHGE